VSFKVPVVGLKSADWEMQDEHVCKPPVPVSIGRLYGAETFVPITLLPASALECVFGFLYLI